MTISKIIPLALILVASNAFAMQYQLKDRLCNLEKTDPLSCLVSVALNQPKIKRDSLSIPPAIKKQKKYKCYACQFRSDELAIVERHIEKMKSKSLR